MGKCCKLKTLFFIKFLYQVDDDYSIVHQLSRAILSYLVSMYGKDDALYPADIRTRALVDARIQFDLGTLYARYCDYFKYLKILKANSKSELEMSKYYFTTFKKILSTYK
uniref:KIF-binding protein n=1 Tax=Megaselia scalaris TaxID=36166 RepID=T1GKC3_MEGSC